MDCVVLDSKPQNQYGDTPEEYSFPRRYLEVFRPAAEGRPVFALIYEPRGQNRGELGRMAYVGWATITSPPEMIAGHPQGWYRVRYATPFHPFDEAVPRRLNGITIEARLRDGQEHQIGNAVRRLPEPEAQLILEVAYGGRFAPEAPYPDPLDAAHGDPLQARERVDRLIRTIERDASFSDRVLAAYDGRCAVSGFEVGSRLPRRTHGLLDAAHIQPVARNGPDQVWNGLALTPTLHRLFDSGLFTLDHAHGNLVVVTSSRLAASMIESDDARWRLDLRTGTPLRTPTLTQNQPSAEMTRYHQQNVFQP